MFNEDLKYDMIIALIIGTGFMCLITNNVLLGFIGGSIISIGCGAIEIIWNLFKNILNELFVRE